MGAAYEDHDLVFAEENGTALLPEDVPRLFDNLPADVDVRRIRFHHLRHSAANLMLAGGVGIAIVSKRLGHSSIGVTAVMYYHLVGSAGRSADDACRGDGPGP